MNIPITRRHIISFLIPRELIFYNLGSFRRAQRVDSMDVSKLFVCLYALLSLSMFVDSKFKDIHSECYHDRSKSCREGVKTRNLTSDELNRISEQINLTKASDRAVSLSANFTYPSRNYYCYPYLNLMWSVLPDVLNATLYFHIKILFDFFGQELMLNKLMSNTIRSEVPVKFSFACHQVAYPGVIYRTFVSALNKDFKIISSSNRDFSGPCEMRLDRNQASQSSGLTLKDVWIPDYRVVHNIESLEIYFTMPDCKIGIWSITVELKHVQINKTFPHIKCVCPFKDSMKINSLPSGNYTLTFSIDTTISMNSKKILQHRFEFLNGTSIATESTKITSTEVTRHPTPIGLTNVTHSKNPEIKTSYLLTDGLTENEEKDFKSKLWIGIGGVITFLWLLTLSIFCCRVKSNNEKIAICVRGTLNVMKKDKRISSKGSNTESLPSDHVRSSGHVNTCLERCSTCSENCPECGTFSFEIRFTPPSEVDVNMSKDEILEKLNSFNSLQNDFV